MQPPPDSKWFEACRSLVRRNDALVKQVLKEKTKYKFLQAVFEQQNRHMYKIVHSVDAYTQTEELKITSGIAATATPETLPHSNPMTPARPESIKSQPYRKSIAETYYNPMRSDELSLSIATPRSIPKKKLLSRNTYFDDSPVSILLPSQQSESSNTPHNSSPVLATPPTKQREMAPPSVTASRPRRNRVQIDYSEPSLIKKVRKGHQFFKPKM